MKMLSKWRQYKTTVKAEKAVDRANLSDLYKRIDNLLTLNHRPPFVPPTGLNVDEISSLWEQLEEGEKHYESLLKEELDRQQELYRKAKTFHSEADDLIKFVESGEVWYIRVLSMPRSGGLVKLCAYGAGYHIS